MIKFRHLALTTFTAFVATVPFLLTSCSKIATYYLPYSINFNLLNSDTTLTDLGQYNADGGTSKASTQFYQYIPTSYFVDANKSGALSTYTKYEANENYNWWTFTGIPVFASGVVKSFYDLNIRSAATVTTVASQTVMYARQVVNFLTQPGIVFGDHEQAWYNALFGEKFGATFNNDNKNDFYAFTLARQNVLNEGNKFPYNLDVSNIQLTSRTNNFGPGPFISSTNPKSANINDIQFLSTTQNPFLNIKKDEAGKVQSASAYDVPYTIQQNQLTYSFYNFYNDQQSFKSTDWVINDLSKIQDAINHNTSWQSKKVKEKVGGPINLTGTNFTIKQLANTSTADFPASLSLDPQTTAALCTDFRTQQYLSLVDYLIAFDSTVVDPALYPYLSYLDEPLPIWTFYKIRDNADLANLNFSQDIVLDETLFKRRNPEDVNSKYVIDFAAARDKWTDTFFRYFIRVIKPNQGPYDQTIINDQTLTLKDHIYSLMYAWFILGNNNNLSVSNTKTSDIIAIR